MRRAVVALLLLLAVPALGDDLEVVIVGDVVDPGIGPPEITLTFTLDPATADAAANLFEASYSAAGSVEASGGGLPPNSGTVNAGHDDNLRFFDISGEFQPQSLSYSVKLVNDPDCLPLSLTHTFSCLLPQGVFEIELLGGYRVTSLTVSTIPGGGGSGAPAGAGQALSGGKLTFQVNRNDPVVFAFDVSGVSVSPTRFGVDSGPTQQRVFNAIYGTTTTFPAGFVPLSHFHIFSNPVTSESFTGTSAGAVGGSLRIDGDWAPIPTGLFFPWVFGTATSLSGSAPFPFVLSAAPGASATRRSPGSRPAPRAVP